MSNFVGCRKRITADDDSTVVPTDRSLHLSRLLAHFFQQQQSNNTVETDVFLKLTSNALLPEIHKDAAIFLLDAERRFLNMSISIHHGDVEEALPPVVVPEGRVTNLQERCIRSILSNWNEINLLSENSPSVQLLSQQSSFILARLFFGAVSTAQAGNQKLKREHQAEIKKLKRKYKALKDECESYDYFVNHSASEKLSPRIQSTLAQMTAGKG
jgi:hypothetical protein